MRAKCEATKYSLSLSPEQILQIAISAAQRKVAVLFSSGFLGVCSTVVLTSAITNKGKLLASAAVELPRPYGAEDLAWSQELLPSVEDPAPDESAEDSCYLAFVSGSSSILLYKHSPGATGLSLFAGRRTAKLIDAIAWKSGELALFCCFQGVIEECRIDEAAKTLSPVRSIDLTCAVDEGCLRISTPLPNIMAWEGTDGCLVLYDLHTRTVKAVSADFALIPMVLAGQFNNKMARSGEEEEMTDVCERNWVKELAQSRAGTLCGFSQFHDIIVCPNYFSTMKDCCELLAIPAGEFSYRLSQEDATFLEGAGRLVRIRTKNHVEVIEWSTYKETQGHFVTYDVADQLLMWRFERGKKSRVTLVGEMEVSGVGLVRWIGPDKLLLVINRTNLAVIEFAGIRA